NPIDSFVFARLAQKGMALSPEADRATLINRVSLTLNGLPPTLAQVDAFVHDTSPNAYEKVVDRLLASPAYGERMAGMWMDLSRWADTNGYEDDGTDSNLWPWRDWVINSFNQNMPYDKFVTMQVAGDLMPHRTRDDLVATEFLRLGLRAAEAGDINEQFRIESVVDDTDTVGQALLGYTVGCARCHDHKFDPISQKDFYSFSGFFNSLDAPGNGNTAGGPTLPWPTAAQQLQLTKAQRKVDDTSDAYHRVLTADTRRAASEVAAWLRNPGQSSVASASSGPARLVRTALIEPSEPAVRGTANEAQTTRLIQSSLQQAQVAYYPFDSVQPIPKSAWPTLRLKPLPRHGGFFFGLPYPKRAGAQPAHFKPQVARVTAVSVSKDKAGASKSKTKSKKFDFTADGSGAPIGGIGLDGKENPLVPVAYTLSKLRFSPSGMLNGAPAVTSDPKLGPGVKGQALYLTASNDSRTYLSHVGYYNRWQPYSVDLWFYPAKRYDTYTDVFTQTTFPDSDTVDNGGKGYELVMLKDGRLEFFISHARPFNMLAVSTKTPLTVKQWAHLDVTYDGSSKAAGVHLYLNGKALPVNVVQDNLTQDALPPISHGFFDEYTGFAFGTRFQEAGPVGSAIDEFRMFDRALTPIEVAYLHGGDKAVSQALQADRSSTAGQLAHLVALRDPALMQAHQALNMARKQENEVATSIPQMLVYEDLKKPRPTYLLYRGEWDSRKEQVPLQAPTQLFAWSDKYPRTRLGLMQWVFDPKNPLTARVFVNRLWLMNFGTGLVPTQDDFGSQGLMPTYLHLVDYLALKFQESGWNIKQMQKMIVMSATFRQSSLATPAQRVADPKNDWLARGPRFRMSYRQIRDSALFDAGILDPKIGGPSTYPYQPAGLVFGYPQPNMTPDWEQHRRTVYSFIKRNGMNPQLQLLDAADPTVSIGKMGISNTPMQALLLLNGPQYQEAYRMM
ncbi:MAG: DUF1549 domain-containing protein, partial [Steroidobacteraceae bacterium]